LSWLQRFFCGKHQTGVQHKKVVEGQSAIREELSTTRRELRTMQNIEASSMHTKTVLCVQQDKDRIEQLTARVNTLQAHNTRLRGAAQREAHCQTSGTLFANVPVTMADKATLKEIHGAEGAHDMMAITGVTCNSHALQLGSVGQPSCRPISNTVRIASAAQESCCT
jgi:hypothetical protein